MEGQVENDAMEILQERGSGAIQSGNWVSRTVDPDVDVNDTDVGIFHMISQGPVVC